MAFWKKIDKPSKDKKDVIVSSKIVKVDKGVTIRMLIRLHCFEVRFQINNRKLTLIYACQTANAVVISERTLTGMNKPND